MDNISLKKIMKILCSHFFFFTSGCSLQ